MKKLLSAVALVLLLASCGTPDEAPEATDEPAAASPDVKAAPKGEANVPKAGTYVYDYESKVTNAATPNATPSRSADDAELTATVTVDGDVVTTAERSTEGQAVATTKRRYTDDGIVELSFETKSPQGASGCTYDEPVDILPFPINGAELQPQPFDGEGTSCDGDRTVTVGSQEDVEDADGVTWSTWEVEIVNEVRSNLGVTSRSTLTLWFSPDLGKEIRTKSVVENIDAEGDVLARGETATVLKSYPS